MMDRNFLFSFETRLFLTAMSDIKVRIFFFFSMSCTCDSKEKIKSARRVYFKIQPYSHLLNIKT